MATRHSLNFNSLSYDKFEELCFWLLDDSGEYEIIEHYGGTGDKNRDVIGYTSDGEVDYFQCKRYEGLTYSVLKNELDGILQHVATGEIKKPRRLYFVLSSSVSADAKDKAKKYATDHDLVEPAFWEPVVLDKKVKRNDYALENFFGISNKTEEKHQPEVDTTGPIVYGTHDTTFQVTNHGDIPAVDCSWHLLGFGWPDYFGGPPSFDLSPEQKMDLRIAMEGQFMGLNPIKELRLHFKFRDSKNNWYYSERYLTPELVRSQAFYAISSVAGQYIPAKPLLANFSITSIDPLDPTGLNATRLVSYTYNDAAKSLKVSISTTLSAVWQFTPNEIEGAFKELAGKRITQMIKTGKFEEDFSVTTYLKPTSKNGFDAYKELRDSIV